MNLKLCCFFIGLAGLLQPARINRQDSGAGLNRESRPGTRYPAVPNGPYEQVLQFNIYRFIVSAPDSGRVRTARIKAYRGDLLLTSFTARIDGAVGGADVADLDENRFPELYLFSISDGSGSFGRVYGWQFMPERKATISLSGWYSDPRQGYMGNDSLWIEHDRLYRKYPVYRAGDAHAKASGGCRVRQYWLKPAGADYVLTEK